jgi:hypothetical protein
MAANEVGIWAGGLQITQPPASGQLLVGNNFDFTLNTLSAGSGIQIVNSPGTITISLTGSPSGFIYMEQLTVTGSNALSNLTHAPNNNLLIIFVNGNAFFPVGSSASFSVSGQVVTWSSTIYGISTSDSVYAVYTY